MFLLDTSDPIGYSVGMNAQSNFRVVTFSETGAAGVERAAGLQESYMAADIAENWLLRYGTPGSSYAELRFNGDAEAHTMMFLMASDEIGVWNTDAAKWPLYYPDHDQYGDTMLDGIPWEELENKLNGDDESEGKKESDDDADNLNLGLEDEGDAEVEDDDDGEEESESDEDLEDDFTPEEDGPDEGEAEAESEDEGDDENETETDDESDGEEDAEMPRLKIFAKLRGPKGWRKRAEAEELELRNVFALKVGVLPEDYDPENDEEERTTGELEQEVICHVEFIERDEDRQNGILRIKLPTGVTLDDFKTTASGLIVAQVPYKKPEESEEE